MFNKIMNSDKSLPDVHNLSIMFSKSSNKKYAIL
jgi:hypothetical protein